MVLQTRPGSMDVHLIILPLTVLVSSVLLSEPLEIIVEAKDLANNLNLIIEKYTLIKTKAL